jgi:hypothetical protein
LVQNGDSQEVEGKDIPVERFFSVAVRDLVPPPRITYDTTESQTPIPTDVQVTSETKSPSTSSAQEDILDDDPNISSPSSPSVIEDDVSDEPFTGEEDLEDEEDEEMSDYVSDDSNDFNPRRNKRLRLSSRSNRTSSRQVTPDATVHVKQVAKAPKSRVVLNQLAEVKKPKVIVAKAPRSRAGRNPPEVMSRRTSQRRM